MSSRERPAEDTDLTPDSIDALTDSLLVASRLLIAISVRSIAEADVDITLVQFRTLMLLSAHGPINLATLASDLNVQPSTTSRMVDRLVRAKLIERRASPSSRREVRIELTDDGREIVRRVLRRRRDEIEGVVRKMPAEQRVGLVRALTSFTVAGNDPTAHEAISHLWP